MKKSEEIGFMKDFGRSLGYNNYKNKQIIDPAYEYERNKASNRRYDTNADKWGLGYGGDETRGTPKYYTNDDVYVPEGGAPRIGRLRSSRR